MAIRRRTVHRRPACPAFLLGGAGGDLVDIATKKPKLNTFLQLEARFDDVLSRLSMLSEQEADQRKQEIQMRLRAVSPHLPPGDFTIIADAKKIALVFSEEERKAWLTPTKRMAAIEREKDEIVAEITDFFAELPFDGELFIEKRYRRDKSSGDAIDFSNLRSQIVVRLLEDDRQEPTPEPHDRYPRFPKVRPKGPESGYAYDCVVKRWGMTGPGRSMSAQKVTRELNEHRTAEDVLQNPGGGFSYSTIYRLLHGKRR
jgi:hypothetical protein